MDFLRLCSCQVSSYSEYFIEIFVSLMSQVEEETPISHHREGNVLFNKGVWAMLTPPPLNRKKKKIQIFGNAILKAGTHEI